MLAQPLDVDEIRQSIKGFEHNEVIEDTSYVHMLNRFSESFQYINLDSMQYYAQKALYVAEKLQYLEGMVEATRLKSSVYLRRGEFKKVVDLTLGTRLKIEDTQLKSEKALMDQYIGIAYCGAGFYKAGIPYLLRSLDAYRQLGDSDLRVFQNLNNLGVAYIKLKDFEEALEIFLELDSLPKEDSYEMSVSVNLAYAYSGLGRYEEAKTQCNKVLSFPKEKYDPRGFGYANFQLGKLLTEERDYEGAVAAYEESISIFENIGNTVDQVPSYDGLTKIYLENGRKVKALKYASIALEKAEASDAMDMRKLALETNYMMFKRFGEYEKALSFYESFTSVSDSLENAELSEELGRLSAEYKFNEKKNELLLNQQRENLENQQAINHQKRLVYLFIMVIVAGAVILFIVYRNYKSKKKHSLALEEKNLQIEKQSEVLQKANHVKNRLFSILAHDLRSPLNSLNGLLMILESKVASPQEIESLLPQLGESFDRNSNLLNNLLHWACSQLDGYKVVPERFDIVGAIRNDLQLFETRANKKGVTLSLTKNEPYQVYADKNMVELVLINLLSNAIKYCKSGDNVSVFVSVEDQVLVEIQDTGIGMDGPTLDKIFQDSFFSTNGTK